MSEPSLLNLIQRYPQLESCERDIEAAFCLLRNTFQQKRKVLIAGNGGSASDADHIAGELLKAFAVKKAPESLPQPLSQHLQHALPAIPLANLTGICSAFQNDCEPEWAFAQLTFGLGTEGDCLWCLSTSGNSKNILNAAQVAHAKGMKVLGLTGETGGQLKPLCDVCICVPEQETFKIQELHLPIYHSLCLQLESYFFDSL